MIKLRFPRCRAYSCDFGKLRVGFLLDSTVMRDSIASSFGIGASCYEVSELCRTNFIEDLRYEHPFIPMVLDTGASRILVDTGLGQLAQQHPQLFGRLPKGELRDLLNQFGVKPADIDAIIISHGHPDHIGGLLHDGQPAFPNADVYVSEREHLFWSVGENVREARRRDRELYAHTFASLGRVVRLIRPGDRLFDCVTIVDAAGHSPGMIGCLIEAGSRRLLNWADTCSHYVFAVQRPEWYADLDDYKEQAVLTRSRLLGMAADQRILVAGFHMPFPGIGHIVRRESGYQWIPIAYQLEIK